MSVGVFKFITGPMFCGKTEELIRIATRYTIGGKRILICSPKRDDRYGAGVICTHNEKAVSAEEIIRFSDVFPKIFNHKKKFDAIFIDEIQFIQDVNIKDIRSITEGLKTDLYVAGLTLDSFREPFPEIMNVLPYAEILQLDSVCDFCGSLYAKYTHRKTTESKQQVLVGGKESYCAICVECLNKEQKESV